MYYDICPDCGAHLDPGEKCDCEKARNGGRKINGDTGLFEKV